MTYEGEERRDKPRDRPYRKRSYGGRDSDRGHGERRSYRPRDGESGERREYRPRRDGDRPRRNYGEKRDFRPRDGDSGERREYRPRREYNRDSDGERKDFTPREEGSEERREYRPRREYGDRPRRDRNDRGRGERRSYGDRGRSEGRGSYGDRRREYRPRDDRSEENRDAPREEGSEERREYRPRREYGDRPRRDRNDRDRNDRGRGERRSYGDRPRRSEHSEEERDSSEREQKPKQLITNDPQKLLFRGVDFHEKGNDTVAMIMYLHGAVLMSKGCENNAMSILRSMEKEDYPALREKMVSEDCSEDALVELDYICYIMDHDYDRSYLESKFEEGNIHAIYCKIRLEELDGEDPKVDRFASHIEIEEEKIVDGLKYIKRKKDSKKAANHLEAYDKKKKLGQSVRNTFIHAKKGDKQALKELERLAPMFPEAAFFLDYLAARAEGEGEEWLRMKYPQFSETIISMEANLDIKDTPFGLFIRAKNIQAKKNEWIPPMIKAAKAGSPEALEELRPLLRRGDIQRVFASIYLSESDLDDLISLYAEGLDDVTYLDQYCVGDPEKVIMIGKLLGKHDEGQEINWLVRNARNGMDACKEELISRAAEPEFRTRKLLYALHDIGADRESAQLYFDMALDPDLPTHKWLKKLCDDEEVKEFIRAHYEDIGDLATFDDIFVDDGYKKRSSFGGKKSYGGKKSFGGKRSSTFSKGKKRY